MPWRQVSARRVGLVLMGSVLATFTLPLLLPIPQREEGLTLCYPVVGPVQRFNPDLSDSALARTRAHEAAHATQCLSLGDGCRQGRRKSLSQHRLER